MKAWVFAALGLVPSASATLVEFNQNFMALGAKRIQQPRRISFQSLAMDPQPYGMSADDILKSGEEFMLRVPGKNNLCADDGGAQFDGQTNFHLWTCDSSNLNQIFRYDAEKKLIRSSTKNNLCVDDGGGLRPGESNFHLWTCDEKNNNQIFVYDEDVRRFRNPTKDNLCMDDGGATTPGGADFHVWNCAEGPNQLFEIVLRTDFKQPLYRATHPTLTSGEEFLLRVPGKPNLCMDDGGGTHDGETEFHLWTCDASNLNQIFRYDESTNSIRSSTKAGLCVDDGGGQSAGETNFHLWSCDPNNKNQKFIYDVATESFRNPTKNNLCMDDGGGQAPGQTKFHLWDCSEANKNQHFEIIPRENFGRVQCSFSEKEENSGEVTVLLAISKCLNQSSIDLIESWVAKVKASKTTYLENGVKKTLTFSTTLVEGQCEARSERVKRGFNDEEPGAALLSDGTNYLLSDEVLPGEIERIQAFAKFGRVLEAPPLDPDEIPIAVVGFVNNEKSYDYITQYEKKCKITNSFKFQMCQGGESCQGHFENCVFLDEDVDLFMYNPFLIARSFQCSKLNDGVPVTYVDKNNNRQCYCTCPVGSVMQSDGYGGQECVVVEPETCPCKWSEVFGYQHDNTERLEKCEFKNLASEWRVPVPFPVDNYVSDERINKFDDGKVDDGPHVDVVVTPTFNVVYDFTTIVTIFESYHPGVYFPDSDTLPLELQQFLNFIGQGEIAAYYTPDADHKRGPEERVHYAWREYQRYRQSKIDDVTLTAYGKYELTIDADDYERDAKCVGCVAVVDKFRPKHTTQCPAQFCDNTTTLCQGAAAATAELTGENVKTANDLVADFYRYQSEAINDACNSPSDRCDYEDFTLKNFFESEYSDHEKSFTDGKTCFSPAEVTADFIASAQAKTNPLLADTATGASQLNSPVPPYQCTRCCKYEVQLQEFWTDYRCGAEYDLRHCEGDDGEHCEFDQCLVLFGDTVARVTANIKDDVVKESEKVLQSIVNEGFQTYTQIHRALDCTSFNGKDGTCDFTSSIGGLIDVSVTNKFGSPDDTYVFWRSRVEDDADGWRLWNPTSVDQHQHVFNKPQTKITLEAWTACGIARKFYFYVHLHVHSDIKVCDVFKQMWYQSTVSRAEIASDICAYPGSDFAEITFDYQPNIGLQYARDNLRMHVSSVVCSLTFPGKEPAEIINVEGDSPEIVERFAIELQNQDKTAPSTEFTVSCTFTYTKFDQSTTTQTCELSHVIKDCNGPTIDIPYGECEWDDCAGQGLPGPFEACGGNVVRANEDAAYMDTDDVECCQGCTNLQSVCTPILGLPDIAKDIKRCVPQIPEDAYHQQTTGNYEYDAGYYDELQLMAKTVAEHPRIAAATTLMAVSAMVAVVALVVVRRRRNQEATIAEDAYYPLLY